MTLFLADPDDDAPTFAKAGNEPTGFFDGPVGFIPGVALVKAEAGLVGDLLDGDRRARMGELYSASDDAQTFIDNTFSREDATREAYQRRIDRIHSETGVKLENPMDLAKVAAVGAFGGVPDLFGANASLQADAQERQSAFKNQLADLQAKFPDKAALFDQSFVDDTQAVVTGADRRSKAAAADADELSTLGRLASTFAGSARGFLRDPLQIATLGLGGGPVKGATAAARIGWTILTEAVVNAGVEIPVQVAAQKWRAQNGLESGVVPALKQVGLAAVFGGGIGGLVAGGKEVAAALKVTDKAGREAIERVAIGAPEAGDLGTVSDRLGVPLDALERRVADIARAEPSIERAAFDGAPAGLTSDEAVRLMRDGIEHVEADGALPGGPVQKPARDAAEDLVLSEARAGNDAITVREKPVRFERFDPAAIGTDATAYQYKGGGDDAGVTKRLAGVKRWDATASGKVIVHERTDGQRFVADGHQRLGLAKRLKAEGDASVRLDGYLFREADGWTAEDVRALAAKKNMQEGSGTSMDAAQIMRDRPDIIDDGLPMSGAMMRKGVGLARLSDDAWGMARNGVVDENQAALVGELIADPAMHSAAVRDLAKFAPETDRAARMLLEEIVASGVRHESQIDMFGSFELATSLIGQRVRVLEAAQKTLRNDKRLFGMLADRADVIEAAGNQLDNAGNATRAVTADTLGAIVDRMARSRGPVSDALTEAARRNAAGSPATVEARAFVDEIQGLIERDGLKRLLEEPEPQLAAATHHEPATSQALDAVGDVDAIDAAELEAAGQTSLWDALPDGTDVDGSLRYVSAQDLFGRADRDGYLSDTVGFCEV